MLHRNLIEFEVDKDIKKVPNLACSWMEIELGGRVENLEKKDIFNKTYLGLVSVQYSGSSVSPSTELTSASFVNFILALYSSGFASSYFWSSSLFQVSEHCFSLFYFSIQKL